MGTKVGPSYACLFMGYLEQQFLASYNGPKPDRLFRYIDDYIGMSTTASDDDIANFIDAFNNYNPSIELTHSISHDSLPFLDINLSISDNNSLTTSVYYKQTDSHTYLSYDSCHPPKCKNSIPYSQLLRLRRLCSSTDDFNEKAEEMLGFFAQRGYPDHILQDASSRIRQVDPFVHKPKQTNRVPLVLTYHPRITDITKVIMKNFNILQECTDTKSIFEDKTIVAYRRDRKLSDTFCHSSDPKPYTQPGTSRCNRRVCNTCDHVHNQTQIIGTKSSFNIKQSFTCISRNLIYCLICTKCDMHYIGETKRRLGDRFAEHLRYALQNSRDTPITRHYNTTHHIPSDLEVCGLMYATGSDADRLRKEQEMIFKIGTIAKIHHSGLNINFSAFKI